MTETQFCALEGCYDDVGIFDIGLCNLHVQIAADMYEEHMAEVARSMRRTERADRLGGVYFIKVGDRIKVGWAFNVARRARQYPPGSELLAVKHPVKIAAEHEMHGQLTQWRVAGREWYRDCDEIRAIVAEIVAECGEPWKIKWGTGHQRAAQSIGRRPAAGRLVI